MNAFAPRPDADPVARVDPNRPLRFCPGIRPPDAPTSECWPLLFRQGQLLVHNDALVHARAAPLAAGIEERPTASALNATRNDRLQPALLRPVAAQALMSLPVRHYLGQLDGVDCWAADLDAPENAAASVSKHGDDSNGSDSNGSDSDGSDSDGGRTDVAGPGRTLVPLALRPAMVQLPDALAELVSRAAQLLEWDASHRYCGRCATPTVRAADERARRCPACRLTQYPRHSPVSMALVWRGSELLLARSPHFPAGMYSALAGFVEAGESLEQCLRREVAEEVGVQVDELRYFQSQSWPFPHSLMIAFTARWTGGEIVAQEGEIEDAQWFPIDALPSIPHPYSIAGRLIRAAVAAVREGRTPGECLG